MRRSFVFVRSVVALVLVCAAFPFLVSPVHAAPVLWLPTPLGERWKIIQGYGCGTHNSWDKYALDLVSADGNTYGAPARAAADGTVFVWESGSGTLIINHGGDLYTQYTHLASASVRVNQTVQRGQQIGVVGDRGTKGNPHLHFHAFTANGAWARNRQTVPLSFAEGVDLPAESGCSQHQGEILVAGERGQLAMPGLNFTSDATPNVWYNRDIAITFQGGDIARGYSTAWNSDPGGDAPANQAASSASVQLAANGEGLHTLYVRGWNANGEATVATFGPIGYDVTPPTAPVPAEPQTLAAGTAGQQIHWNAAADMASGVVGYRVYIGGDAQGTSEWYVAGTTTPVDALGAGSYILRVQPIDAAGNVGEWATAGQITVQ